MEQSIETVQPQSIAIKILNPGFDRCCSQDMPYEVIFNNAWAKLQWWESEWQARKGIEHLCRMPFLHLGDRNMGRESIVPTRMLYPGALQSNQTERIEEAARYVIAAVRQAREYYSAAMSMGVTDLSRPVLYFYGALALARAAVVALCGREALESQHGLEVKNGPSVQDQQNYSWPTLLKWERRGDFPAFYRVTRWDNAYSNLSTSVLASRWPTFHILESLRVLGCDWGSLPPAIDGPSQILRIEGWMNLLLPYEENNSLYLTQQAELLDRQFIQVPNVVIQYMVLRYFADLARYHPVIWRELLEGANYPEGYVFRVALENVAHNYIANLTCLLPQPEDKWTLFPQQWCETRPSIEEWYQPPRVITGYPVMNIHRYYLEEWNGEAEVPN